jgi:hypothetical protein
MTRRQVLKISAILGAVFCLAPGSRASEHLGDNAKSALVRAEREVIKARDELRRAQEELRQAALAVAKNEKRLDIASKCIQVSQDEWGSQYKALAAAQNDVKRAADDVRRTREQLDHDRAMEAGLKLIRDRVLATEIDLYDMRLSVFIEYNAMTRSFNAWAESPHGLKITSRAIAAAFSGGVPLPQFDLALMLGAALGNRVDRECTYDDEAAKVHSGISGSTLVYVSGRGLSELLAPERGVDGVWKNILSCGPTTPGSVDEVANGCLRELNGVHAFLQETVGDGADELLEKIVKTIVTHEQWETPTVQIKPVKFQMKYTVRPGGTTRLIRYLPGLVKRDGDTGKTLSVPRFGFAVLVRSAADAGSPKDLRGRLGKSKAVGPEVLKKVLQGELYRLLEPAIDDTVDLSSVIAPGMERLFRDFDYSHAKPDRKDLSLMDLRATSISKEFESFAAKYLKIGNSGTALVRRLTFNAQTGQAVIEIDLIAKQKSTLKDAISVAKRSVEDVNDDSVIRWKAAAAQVKKLHDQIPLATSELAQASSKISGLVKVLKIDQEHLTSVLAEQEAAGAALDEATKVRGYCQGRRDAAANSVARAEQNVKDFQKLIFSLLNPRAPEQFAGWRQ